MAKDIGLDPVGMGYVFSAFSWAYVIGQIPGGWLLDRFGSKRVYFWSIFIWSMFTLLQGFVDIFSGFGIIYLRLFNPFVRVIAKVAEQISRLRIRQFPLICIHCNRICNRRLAFLCPLSTHLFEA